MADTVSVLEQLAACAERQDFEGAFALVRENRATLAEKANGPVVREALKKTTKDRLLLSFLDAVDFANAPLDKALVALEKLVGFQLGTLVLSRAWGLGEVRRLDYFYKRITVDFKTKKGHQFTYAAAVDMLERAPENHILVKRQANPGVIEQMIKEKPGDFVCEMLASYGDMTLVKLEETCVANGFVKSVNWKGFWEKARAELRQNKRVTVPAKRADPIQLKASVEEYGDGWLTAFAHETDPKLILASVREFVAQGKFKAADEQTRVKIGERLAFAVVAARKVDDALYARLACCVRDLGFLTPAADAMRGYLWERKRFIKAAAALPAREVGAMISFLAVDAEAKDRLFKAIPDLCFAAVCEIVSQFANEPTKDAEGNVTGYPCRKAVGDYLKLSQAPATLVTLVAGKIEQFGTFRYGDVEIGGKKIRVLKDYALWAELPGLPGVLAHAIALGEGRRSGETLKMQNLIRRLFGDKAWLEKMFKLLAPAEQVSFFERFQASIAWDPSTHHALVMRMTHLVPELEKHLVRAEKKREYARVTSYRSFGLRKQEYLKLINEDMPANVKRIEFAKSYGDLSENAEYQYAKDEQRALMQKQTLMQQDLEVVKPGEFLDATTDEVMPGVSVVVAVGDGEKTYHVLGEWDNDVERGVLSSKTKLAQNMLGKKPGDNFEVPGEGPTQFGRIVEIKPLPAEIREWMKLPEGVQI